MLVDSVIQQDQLKEHWIRNGISIMICEYNFQNLWLFGFWDIVIQTMIGELDGKFCWDFIWFDQL